ncbi:MAG: SAVED domain-containing protein [Bacteroidetes bacterium SB0662_bin_6]|nr:SAVED domain-containing protein [Bacteroidetes bacterium SB0668_bin_1]MYE04253.1 SAVED domain-containing protein [Bacteroidetes bacterium SB0662_bin_6]
MGYFKHFVRDLAYWVFRRRSPAIRIMKIGLGCLTMAFSAGWALDFSFPFRNGRIDLGFDSAGGTSFLLVYGAAIVGFFLILAGFIWEVIRYRTEQRRLSRKRVVVVEARGLRDTAGTPLVESIPSGWKGHRDQILIDIRQRIKDGEIEAPEAALADIISLTSDLRRREGGLDRNDFMLVYGGLTPVPFTFLTGVLIDDENAVRIFDWDRHAEVWRQIDGKDDGKRFKPADLSQVPDGSQEIALAVSVSYGVNANDVRAKVGRVPIVTLDLEDGSPDCHWSEEKQRALGKQFLDTVIRLGNRGVRRIHLFLAAQNSVVFRFGRLYDKRNLPEIIVYQFERAATPPYPWGILMPVCGIDRPEVTWN